MRAKDTPKQPLRGYKPQIMVMEREQINRPIIFSLIGFTIILVVSLWAYMNGALSFGDFLIGDATVFLAFATVILAFTQIDEGRINRNQISALAEKDRRRLRLKEQLEGLYSPLIGIGRKDFIVKPYHRYEAPRGEMYGPPPHYIYEMMVEIRGKYKFLAEDELKEALDHYYKFDSDQWKKMRTAESGAILEGLWDKITEEFDCLSLKYSVLTKSLTRER